MHWMICTVLLCITASVPAAVLIHRKLRQLKRVASLRIDNAQGIVEERFVRIGAIEQWISIRGEDRNNPVLLVLHGGPGSCYSIFTSHLRPWEKHFTVVQWDQRGGGENIQTNGLPR